jgi:hypothetical protein
VRRIRVLLAGLGIVLSVLVAYGIGLRIQIKFSNVRGYIDPKYIDGKFYRRPIHPGFITQRFPAPTSRIVLKKGRWSDGLSTSKELREE